jgi:16S rRNA C967 or C1407 C5-methylase (RsmB/RsmF family)
MNIKNKQWESYYKNIIPQKEWTTFVKHLTSPLPLAFRIISNDPKLSEKIKMHINKHYPTTELILLDWYPTKYAYKTKLSKHQLNNDFVKFIKNQSKCGNIYMQEEVSMMPVTLLNIKKNDIILDMCASPGSKTSQLLEQMISIKNNNGYVIANDIKLNRLNVLVKRMSNNKYFNKHLIVTDNLAQSYPNTSRDNKIQILFDHIVCDVICSGDGTLRKSRDLWNKWSTDIGKELQKTQIQILSRAVELIKVGGNIVYSTCSLNPVENEEVVKYVLSKYKEASIVKCYPKFKYTPGIDLNNTFRIYPHYQNSGGFYIALLTKKKEIPFRFINQINTNDIHVYNNGSLNSVIVNDNNNIYFSIRKQHRKRNMNNTIMLRFYKTQLTNLLNHLLSYIHAYKQYGLTRYEIGQYYNGMIHNSAKMTINGEENIRCIFDLFFKRQIITIENDDIYPYPSTEWEIDKLKYTKIKWIIAYGNNNNDTIMQKFNNNTIGINTNNTYMLNTHVYYCPFDITNINQITNLKIMHAGYKILSCNNNTYRLRNTALPIINKIINQNRIIRRNDIDIKNIIKHPNNKIHHVDIDNKNFKKGICILSIYDDLYVIGYAHSKYIKLKINKRYIKCYLYSMLKN